MSRRRRRRSNRRLRGSFAIKASLRSLGRGLAGLLRKGLPVYAWAASLVVVGGGLYAGFRWATTADRFRLAEVRVTGLEHLPRARVDEVLAPAMGGNVFTTDIHAIEARLARLAWVDEVEVRRQLPDRLVAEVHEREATALISMDGLYLVDEHGHPFKRADIDRGEGDGLLVVTGLSRDRYHSEPEATEAVITRAVAIARDYALVPGRPRVGEVHVEPLLGYTLVLAETGARLTLGDCDDDVCATRLARFDTAWAALSEKERARAMDFFIDNKTSDRSVTIALAGNP